MNLRTWSQILDAVRDAPQIGTYDQAPPEVRAAMVEAVMRCLFGRDNWRRTP